MPDATSRPAQVRALCCECGRLRKMSPYGGLRRYGEAEDDGRCVAWRKCATCGRRTEHAWLRDGDPYADSMEPKAPVRPARRASRKSSRWAYLKVQPLPAPAMIRRKVGLCLLVLDPFATAVEVLEYCEDQLTRPEWEAYAEVLESWHAGPAFMLDVPPELWLLAAQDAADSEEPS